MAGEFVSKYPEAGSMSPVDPVDVPLGEFPRDEEVPEGCLVLDDLEASGLYSVDLRQFTYCTRVLDGGEKRDLRLYALVPCTDNPLKVQSGGTFPVVMYCQGSAWGEQWIYGHFAQHVELARHGFVVVSVEYRPSGVATFPAQAEDFSEAVRFVREHASELDADVSRMGAWGDSSGAHTVLTCAYADDTLPGVGAPFACVVDWYGPTDLQTMGYYASSSSHLTADCPEALLIGGKSVLEEPLAAAAASPVNYVRPGLPPTLILHGGRDELVPFNQSCRLYERLRAAGNDVTFYKLSNANHGKDLFGDPRVFATVLDFLRRHLAC